MRSLLLVYTLVQAVCLSYGQGQPSDGNNLETFPSIVDSPSSTSASSPSSNPTSASRVFSSQSFGHGPAVSPTSYLTSAPSPSTDPSTTSANQTTLVSASRGNYTGSQPSVTVYTSTVSGSDTTVTITSSGTAANRSGGGGTSDAARSSQTNRFRVGVAVACLAGALYSRV